MITSGVSAFRPFLHTQSTTVAEKAFQPPEKSALKDRVGQGQVLDNPGTPSSSAAQLGRDINAYPPSESDWQDFVAATLMVSDEVRNDLIFDPGAWEKHANVLVAAIIALNVARVANAQLRGHFGVMAADAAKSQGAAIVESGKAAMYSAITAALVSGVIAGFSMVKTLQGQGLKHADINLHKRNALEAGTVERDLKIARARDDWDPQTTYKLTVFDDFGRTKVVDFKPEGSILTAREQAWFDAQIIKTANVGQTSDWLSQMGSKGVEKKLEFGRALSAMSMSMSQLVSSMVRMAEHAAREKEVLQQSAQSTQKSLSDEVGQKDSADAALLQKFMDIVMQILQSRIEVIGKIV
ncbi:cell invasion protein [Pseudomonas sp. 14P_8.1_Bac3]|uniref:cell invasion protein n=1 Tax=Pseudomonas sp. 14P_8.1_Bac3 TaxID=2971621 RepID=UPI0021CA8B3B|nr:cell invasion protein [Pseudomonas sp. 14P_8.1_Bac3]MCU1761469.1 cell invasion protein [Pseudomonas sp. 14P_8.1_Bac3]